MVTDILKKANRFYKYIDSMAYSAPIVNFSFSIIENRQAGTAAPWQRPDGCSIKPGQATKTHLQPKQGKRCNLYMRRNKKGLALLLALLLPLAMLLSGCAQSAGAGGFR